MAKIKYTKTYFNEPSRINEETYTALKLELNRNSNFEIDPNPETFSQHFSGILLTLKICSIGIIVSLILGLGFSKHAGDFFDNLAGVGLFCTIIMIFAGIPLLLEGPSYATYIKTKTEFFSKMKYAIQNTNSYREFCVAFYGK